MSIELVIETSEKRFANWLENLDLPEATHNTAWTRTPQGQEKGFTHISILYGSHEEIDGETYGFCEEIRFKILPLAENRIKVSITCLEPEPNNSLEGIFTKKEVGIFGTHPAFLVNGSMNTVIFYLHLLQQISTLWPETKTQLQALGARPLSSAYKNHPGIQEAFNEVFGVVGRDPGMDTAEVEQIEQTGEKPWEKIPDRSYHRHMLKLWHEGHSARKIGFYCNVEGKTIHNKLSELRKRYGEEIVPLRRK